MFNVTDQGTIAATIGFIKRVRDQVPYGTALGLNNLAVEAQSDTENSLVKQKFNIRTPWYKHGSKYGFNITFAKKTDNPMEARMGSQAYFLKLQEEGGVKTATNSGSVSLPDDPVWPDKSVVIPKGDRPTQIIQSDDEPGFFIHSNRLNQWFLARRTAFDDAIDKGIYRGGLQFMYGFKKSVNVKPRFDFVPTETALVKRRYSEVMEAAMAKAIATAK